MPDFIMLVGIPGSGKSTYAKRVNERYTIISRDDLVELAGSQLGQGKLTYTQAFKEVDHQHVDKLLHHKFLDALELRKDIILDMTNLTIPSRKRRMSQVSNDYTKYAVYFPITEELMLERANAREAEGKMIPEKVLKGMFNSLEVPTEAEGFNTVVVIHD